ncbi:MAG: hypothetical protein FJX74_15540, partial [Armatimonadetes bacterium]|nr:hypothetical protein [Armatimonadota bacterium]
MRCRSVCRRLTRYQDGDLPPAQTQALAEHLRGCPGCRRELAALKAVAALLNGLGEVEPDEAFTRDVLRAVAGERIAEPARPLVSTGLTLAAVGLVLSTIILVGLAGGGPLDLSSLPTSLASLVTAATKVGLTLTDVAGPVLTALFEGLAAPVAWLLLADVVALAVVVAGGRRLLVGRSWRGV